MMTKLTMALATMCLLMMPLHMAAQTAPSISLEQMISSTQQEYSLEYQYMLSRPSSTISVSAFDNKIRYGTSPSLMLHHPQSKTPSFSDINLIQSEENKSIMTTNRRIKYSSLWAFTSLNYLYADLVGLMDLNLLSQYQTGVVNGVEITPGFLTAAAAYMQLPLANVFLPHIIKNEKTLRWIQIVCGSIATLVQGATLFVGKPAPYYVLFSAIEMGATTYITIDALKWKTKRNKNKKPIEF